MDWPTDIVAQLRLVSCAKGETIHERHPAWLCHKAADEIEKLRLAIENGTPLAQRDDSK